MYSTVYMFAKKGSVQGPYTEFINRKQKKKISVVI